MNKQKAELIECLSEYSEDEQVYIINDNGYTFGSINYEDVFDCKN